MKSFILILSLMGASLLGRTQSPGGVSSGLTHWYKANAGMSTSINNSRIASWSDQSPSGNTASQSTVINRPFYFTAGSNGNPYVYMNSGNQYLTFNAAPLTNADFTIISVVKRASSTSNQYFMGAATTAPNTNFSVGYSVQNRATFAMYGNSVSAAVPNFDASSVTPSIFVTTFSTTSGKALAELNDGSRVTASSSNTTNFASSANGYLGRGSNGLGMIGQLSEVIAYNRVLSATEIKQVETYLSIKYGLTIPTSEHLYFTDATYGYDMFGIGKDLLVSGLNQTTSSSESADDMLEVSSPSGLDNGEYLMFGNNNGARTFSAYGGTNARIYSALPRRWLVKEVGETGTSTLKFDLTGLTGFNSSNLVLLVDANGNGFDDDIPMVGTYSAPYMTFTNVNLADGSYMTLGEYSTKWYAVTSGNANGSVWATSPTGTARTLPAWSSLLDLEINSGVSITQNVAGACRGLNIPSGASLSLGTYSMDIYGDLTVNGTLSEGTSSVSLKGSAAQNIAGSANIYLYDLTCANAAGVNLTCTELRMIHALNVSSGTLTTNSKLVLWSDGAGTASVGQLAAGAISGNVTVQRYHHAGATGWVNLCSPVQNTTVALWNDDFVMTGFTGSNMPAYSFNSVQTYNESVAGNRNTGYVGMTNTTNTLVDNKGYYVYMNAGNYNIDVAGPLYIGDRDLPVTFTNNGNATADGFCLVGNPYASTIDWDSPNWVKTNMTSAVYVWNSAINQYATYIGGVATNGGSPYIAQGQSFFVQASGASPILRAKESVKTTVAGTFKAFNTDHPTLTLHLEKGNLIDETTITWKTGSTAQYDIEHDGLKLMSPSQTAPYMCTYSADGEELSINAMEKTNEEWSMPLMINALETGDYTLTCKGLNTFSAGSCVTITDMRTGQSYILSEENPITLRLQAETAEEPRFMIHSGKPILASINDVSCFGARDGSATVADPETSLSLLWKNAAGKTIHTSTNLTISETLGNLSAGTYTIETLNNGACGTSSFSFEITEPAEITPNATIESTTCHDSEDGSIELDIQGGFGNYMVDWNTGDTGSALYDIKTGKYTATITDLMGCSRTQEFEVTSEFAAVPNFQFGKENYILNEETVALDIHNFSMEADEYEWVLEGFGVISNEEQPEILMAAPGTYTLTLVASNTKCSNSMTKQFTIAQPSGTDILQSMIKGVVTEEGIRLQFFLEESNVFDIKLINVLGQQISETVHGQYGNQTITLPTGDENGPVIVFIHDATTGENCAIKLSL